MATTSRPLLLQEELPIRGPEWSVATLKCDSTHIFMMDHDSTDNCEDEFCLEAEELLGEDHTDDSLASLGSSLSSLKETVLHVLDDAVKTSLKEEEKEKSPLQSSEKYPQARVLSEQVKERIGVAVSDSNEFRRLQASIRASGLTTGAGTKQFLISLASHSL